MAPAKSACSYEATPLVLAIFQDAPIPLLLLDTDLRVLSSSASFREAFVPIRESVDGLLLFDIDANTWDVPQVRRALAEVSWTANREACCEIDFVTRDSATRRIALNVRKIHCIENQRVLLLVALTDLTEHRAERRLRLQLQQEQAALVRDVVRLRAQLEDVCASVGVSIDASKGELSLSVLADDSVSNPRLSAALGAVVTTLVMEALKEANPDFTPGAVHLDYHPDGPGWALRLRAAVNDYVPDSTFLVSLSVDTHDEHPVVTSPAHHTRILNAH